MRFLLHISDFHLRPDYTPENGNKLLTPEKATISAIEAIAKKLRKENIQIDYMIHTGDVIDANNVGKKYFETILNQLKTPAGTDYLIYRTQNKDTRASKFESAHTIFESILKQLNIPAGNAIVCCGNHDADRRQLGEYTKCRLNADGNAEEKKEFEKLLFLSNDSFKNFNEFLDRLNAANAPQSPRLLNKDIKGIENSPNQFCSLGDLNILVLNSNWTTPDSPPKHQNCIKCPAVCADIDHILNSPEYRNDNLNIVVAHKPLYEICEKARLTYKNYSKTPFMTILHTYLGDNGVYLCGDKHTRSIIGTSFHDVPHYLSGEPLYQPSEKGIYEAEYNLLGISNGKIAAEWKIHLWSKNATDWTCYICPQDATVSQLYELSRGYISPLSYKYLSVDNRKSTWESLNQILYRDEVEIDYTNEENALHSDCKITNDEAMDRMFKFLASYRKSGNESIDWIYSKQGLGKIEHNIFVEVAKRINDRVGKPNKNVLNLRGPHSTGKSSFLGILYIYLLRLYSMGKIDFIPAYFALESKSMLQKVQKSTTYYQAVKEEFQDFSENIQHISKREGKKVCYIIDRVDEQDYWSYSSESSVGRGILDVLSTCDNAWHIFSYGNYRLPHFKKSMPPRTYNDDSDVLFFSPIEAYKVLRPLRRLSNKPAPVKSKRQKWHNPILYNKVVSKKNNTAKYSLGLRPEFTSFVCAFLEKYGFFDQVFTEKHWDDGSESISTPPSKIRKELITKGLVNEVCKLIIKFRRLHITPGFLRQNYAFLTDLKFKGDTPDNRKLVLDSERKIPILENSSLSIQQVHSYYIDRQLERSLKHMGYDFIQYAPAMAYLFSYCGYTYEQFIRIKYDDMLRNLHPTNKIAAYQSEIYKAFMFITKHDESREYLIALHYHRELQYYTEHLDESVTDFSILHQNIDRPIAFLVRRNWTDADKFIIVCKALIKRNDLKSSCYAVLLYCLAHIQIYEPIRSTVKELLFSKCIDVLKKELPSSPSLPFDIFANKTCKDSYDNPYKNQAFDASWIIMGSTAKQRLDHFLSLRLQHTMMVYCAIETRNTSALIGLLTANEHFRLYNRQHQLLYYQDVTIYGDNPKRPLNPGKDTIHKGMDFNSTMNYLCEKISGAIGKQHKYSLFDYDLFTLCDLILSRYPSDSLQENHLSEKPFFINDSNSKLVEKITNYLILILQMATNDSTYVKIDKWGLDELKRLAEEFAPPMQVTKQAKPTSEPSTAN